MSIRGGIENDLAALPAIADAHPGADPIFAALGERDRLEAIHLAAIEKTDAAYDTGASAEERDAAEEAQLYACHDVLEYERRLFATSLTTAAGAFALLQFIGRNPDLITDREEEVALGIRNAVSMLNVEALS